MPELRTAFWDRRWLRPLRNEDVENRKFEVDNNKFLDIKRETYKYMALFQTTSKNV